MLQVSGMPFHPNGMLGIGYIENVIIQRMITDSSVHSYSSINELMFEVTLRKNIIESARAMKQSQAEFESFEKSRANSRYWHVTSNGGFQLRRGVTPSEAIQDIYNNSPLYAFECATAIVIIYYHAVLNSIGENLFNQHFSNLYLYSWHSDSDLGIRNITTDYFLPGDVVYFNNPDYNPETPWWRGENAVVLEDGTYFGHGAEIATAEQMIEALNSTRKPGSMQSSYLMNSAIRLSFKTLAKLAKLPRNDRAYKMSHVVIHHNESSISFERYLFYLYNTYNQTNYYSNPFS
ncbi:MULTISPECIES: protein-glutamine gamma-glutamyltransferase [Bacillus]|uniref:protein-glutamine gamma-glutamyltransferase n=1 Tax=Bacillus TaxID=1386 RepID=UPI0002DE133C|nr:MULTISPECIES: protein-glutamine gamma-glutamyltransferase [Bacillus]